MSDTHTITDAAILAAWGGADGMDAERRAETAAVMRAAVESDREGVVLHDAYPTYYAIEKKYDVTALRTALGGWPAVWRAVLADEGFEDIERLGREWHRLREPHPTLSVERGAGGHYALAVLGYWIPLRSPAHLRELVWHARTLFGEGPR